MILYANLIYHMYIKAYIDFFIKITCQKFLQVKYQKLDYL